MRLVGNGGDGGISGLGGEGGEGGDVNFFDCKQPHSIERGKGDIEHHLTNGLLIRISTVNNEFGKDAPGSKGGPGGKPGQRGLDEVKSTPSFYHGTDSTVCTIDADSDEFNNAFEEFGWLNLVFDPISFISRFCGPQLMLYQAFRLVGNELGMHSPGSRNGPGCQPVQSGLGGFIWGAATGSTVYFGEIYNRSFGWTRSWMNVAMPNVPRFTGKDQHANRVDSRSVGKAGTADLSCKQTNLYTPASATTRTPECKHGFKLSKDNVRCSTDDASCRAIPRSRYRVFTKDRAAQPKYRSTSASKRANDK